MLICNSKYYLLNLLNGLDLLYLLNLLNLLNWLNLLDLGDIFDWFLNELLLNDVLFLDLVLLDGGDKLLHRQSVLLISGLLCWIPTDWSTWVGCEYTNSFANIIGYWNLVLHVIFAIYFWNLYMEFIFGICYLIFGVVTENLGGSGAWLNSGGLDLNVTRLSLVVARDVILIQTAHCRYLYYKLIIYKFYYSYNIYVSFHIKLDMFKKLSNKN